MNKNIIFSAAAIAVVAPTVNALAKSKKEVDSRPNILYIMTDQQRHDAIGKAGKFPFLKTPNLDKLAEESAYFTNAYTPCAVSGPARSALLTGLLVEHTQVLTNELTAKDPVENGFTTLPTIDQILTTNGYYTEYHGKWHAPISWADCYSEFVVHKKNAKNPYAYELDHFTKYKRTIKQKYGMTLPEEGDLMDKSMFGVPYTPDPIDRRAIYGTDENGNLPAEQLAKRKHAQPDNHGLLKMPDEESLTAYQAKETIAALQRATKQDKPFAVTLSINFPHAPMLPTEGYYRMYDVDQMPTPESIKDPMIDSPYKGQNGRLVATEYSDPEKVKYMMSNYFGLVTEIDHWIGEVLSELDKLGVADNTIVVFVTDHGEMLGSHGMREKNVFYEESARVPLMIRYPDAIKPTTISGDVTTLDIAATLADYVGVKFEDRDSRTLRPQIEGKGRKFDFAVTEWLYNDIRQPSHMIIKDGWKLFLNYSKESKVVPVLFNLNDDPHEMKNLIGVSNPTRSEYVAKAEELKANMIEWLKDRNSGYTESLAEVKF